MAVKRLFVTILAFFYLGLASGVVMNFHYCMGQLSSVEYGYDHKDACGKCGMTEKDGCCKTESKVVQLKDSHQWSKPAEVTKNLAVIVSFESSCVTAGEPINTSIASRDYHPPSDARANQLYLHTGVLLI